MNGRGVGGTWEGCSGCDPNHAAVAGPKIRWQWEGLGHALERGGCVLGLA